MNTEDYEKVASSTATYKDPDYLPLGLAEECGELVHEYARCKRKGVPMNNGDLMSECGDVIWMISQICRENGFTLEDAMLDNMNKLSARDEEGTIHEKVNRGSKGGSSSNTVGLSSSGVFDFGDAVEKFSREEHW